MVISIQILNLNVDRTIHDKYQILSFITSLMDKIPFLVNSLLHKELNLMEKLIIFCVKPLLEVVNLF